MSNHGWMAITLITIGLVGVNFFYASDLLMGAHVVQLGQRSLIAIGVANLVAVAGLLMAARAK